jgi:hypothetical protein
MSPKFNDNQTRRTNKMTYRFKQNSDIDAYGTSQNVIHFKFGGMRKDYNFTDTFREKHPRFVKEFSKYYNREAGLFTDPLAIVKYIENCNLPIRLYANYYDQEFEDFEAVYEWILAEYAGDFYKLYTYDDEQKAYVGLDGEATKEAL